MRSQIALLVSSYLIFIPLSIGHGAMPPEDKLRLEDVIAMTRTRPVTFAETSISTADFLAEREHWALRRILPAAVAELGPAANDPDTAVVLEELVGWWGRYGHDFSAMGRGGFDGMWWAWRAESTHAGMKALAKSARALIPVDAPKPVLQFLIASVVHATKNYAQPSDYNEAIARLRRAIAADDEVAADPLVVSLAVIQSCSLNPPSPVEEKELATLFKRLPAALAEKSTPAADVPFIVDTIISRAGLGSVVKAAPKLAEAFLKSDLPEWARSTLAGYCHLEKVSSFYWTDPRAKKDYQLAGKLLERAWAAHPQRPEAAAGMISVARAGFGKKGEDSRTWFDRATALQCDFAEAYQRMLSTLHPQATKSYSPILAFGLSCAKAGREETDVPEYLLIALGSMARDLPDWRMICRHPEIAAAVQEVLSRRIDLARDADLRKFYQGMAIVWGYMSGSYRLAAQNLLVLQRPEGKGFWWPLPANHFLVNCEIDTNRMIDESLALGDESDEETVAAHRAWEDGDFERAAKMAAVAAGKIPPRRWRDWLRAIQSMSEFSTQYSAGGWVPLATQSGAWYRANKNTTHPDAKALSFATRKGFSAARRYRPDLGESYEVRGEVALPEGASTFRVNLGTPSEYCPSYVISFYSLEVATSDRKMSTVRHGWNNDNSRVRQGPEIGETVQFRVRRQGQKISWWVNEKAIVENEKVEEELPFGACAFGINIDTKGGTAPVTFKKLEARKLLENG